MTRYANQQAYEQAMGAYPQASSPIRPKPPSQPPRAMPDWMAGLQRDHGFGGNPAPVKPMPRTGGPMKPRAAHDYGMDPFGMLNAGGGFGPGLPQNPGYGVRGYGQPMPRRAPKAPQSGGYLDYDMPRSSYGGYGGAYGHNPGDQWGGLYR